MGADKRGEQVLPREGEHAVGPRGYHRIIQKLRLSFSPISPCLASQAGFGEVSDEGQCAARLEAAPLKGGRVALRRDRRRQDARAPKVSDTTRNLNRLTA
jgi:hypothetical protein